MSGAIDEAVDNVVEFWGRFVAEHRAEVDALGLSTELAADALLSAAVGAKLQVSGPRDTARMLYLLAEMTAQAAEALERTAAGAAANSNAPKVH